ncbi:MAG: metal ABC transporter ATP-binding protein [Streptococcaceae bacterium]|nr:metal ABC transporter ATP-binding protein [Streptococcaceae bacterium]
MLIINNLTVAYQTDRIFNNLSINFDSGKITGIIGPNGAGKSTLIKAALGLIKVQTGEVLIDNVAINHKRTMIAYVEQRTAIDLNFPINVLDVVLTGTYPKLGILEGPTPKEKQAARAALAQVKLDKLETRQIGSLSGGQLQRVFVARAIVQDADVVILDEPFVGIDMKSEAEIIKILKSWKALGKTIIVINHDLNKVSEYFDDLAIINRKVVAKGRVDEVYTLANIQKAFSSDLGKLLFGAKGGEND